jgi:tetratricopeptide (TPR) repeat protein
MVRPSDQDPGRWSESPAGQEAAEGASAAIKDAFRREQASPPALTDAALARIGRVVIATPAQANGFRFLVRTAVIAALLLATSGGVVTAARQVLRAREREPQMVTVGARSHATITGRHHRRLTVAGPAKLEIDPKDDRGGRTDFALQGGQLTVEAGGQPLSIRAGDLTVTVPADSSGEIQAADNGQPAAARATSGVLHLHRGQAADVDVTVPPPPTVATPPPAPAPPPPALAVAPPASVEPTAPPPAASLALARPERPRSTGAEAALLARAFRKLRADGNATAALAALDEHDRKFPGGWLHDEATLARAEALLTLGRQAEALALLELVNGAGGTLTRPVRLARGELLAKTGRCERAIEDFSDVLLTAEQDAIVERALAGRATCLWRSGRAQEARQDLQRYVTLFPQGASVEEARRLLQVPR